MANKRDYHSLYIKYQALIWSLVFIILGAILIFASYNLIYLDKTKYPIRFEVSTQFAYALITGGVIAWITKVIFDKNVPSEISNRLKEDLGIEDLKTRIDNIPNNLERKFAEVSEQAKITQAIIDLLPKRQHKDLFTHYLRNAKNRIDIFTSNTHNLESFESEFEEAIANSNCLKIRILALNPSHSFVINRAENDGIRGGDAKLLFDEMVMGLKNFFSLKEIWNKSKEVAEIKIFNNPPSLMIYRFDDVIFLGFLFAKGNSSRNFPHILLNANDPFGAFFINSFEEYFYNKDDNPDDAFDLTIDFLNNCKLYPHKPYESQ